MLIGFIFWVLMLLTIIFWMWGSPWGDRRAFGMSLLVFVLLFLLGWHDFGFIIRG